MPSRRSATALGAELSLWGLFLQADIVVQFVTLGLLGAGVWVAVVACATAASLRRVNTAADAFEDRFWSGGNLDELFDREGAEPGHPMAAVFAAAMGEWRASVRVAAAAISHSHVHRRVEQVIAVAVQRQTDCLANRLMILASVGAIAPLLGLFGLVCGVIDNAPAVAAVPGAGLADVALCLVTPLLAAGSGLFTAALAELARQLVGAGVARFAGRLAGFGGEFAVLLSRQGEAPAADPLDVKA